MKSFEDARVICWAGYPDVLAAAADILAGLGCRVQLVSSTEQFRHALSEAPVDLIIAHLSYCFRESLDFLRRSAAEDLPPFLIASSAYDVGLYMEAMRQGAFDCLGVPLDEKELVRIASRALECHSSRVATCGG